MQVLYLGRTLRTKETLPDFREKCRVTRHSRVFRGLTGSQRTPGIGASHSLRKRIKLLNQTQTQRLKIYFFFTIESKKKGLGE